jgi:hypothetical protein
MKAKKLSKETHLQMSFSMSLIKELFTRKSENISKFNRMKRLISNSEAYQSPKKLAMF